MLAGIKRLIEPRHRADVIRLTILFSVIGATLSAAFTTIFAVVMEWPILISIIPAVVIPLLIAPWMLWVVGGVSLRLYQTQQELERLARTDPLTGVLNRRGAQELLMRAFERRYEDSCFCAVVLDIDNFKAINDRYGHAGGDAVIAHVADVMRMAFDRENFPVARFGGDELGVLMANLSISEATLAAEHLRAAIERTPVVYDDRRIMVTASIGVAELLPEDGSADLMLIRADASLYSAKMLGRNIVRASLSHPEVEARTRLLSMESRTRANSPIDVFHRAS